jgi:hypothetical protein
MAVALANHFLFKTIHQKDTQKPKTDDQMQTVSTAAVSNPSLWGQLLPAWVAR